ncbi:MAG: amino acid deaminase/aldolase, partial [Solirubrobacterales bacterium]
AAMFALPVVRGSGVAPSVAWRARPALPGGGANGLRIGDRLYFRDLEAGELCERFNRLFLVTGTTIRDELRTYRGEGKGFI